MRKRGPGPRRPPGETREAVRRLRNQGKKLTEIATELGLARSTAAYHFRALGIPPDERFARRYDWEAIRRAYESGLSVRECIERYGFSTWAWHDAVNRGLVVPRPSAMPISALLVIGRRTSRTHLKSRLLSEGFKENRCEECGIMEWRGKPLSMALHHVNGDGLDNRLENLLLLCPNCHAQTPNYGGRNGHRKPTAGAQEAA